MRERREVAAGADRAAARHARQHAAVEALEQQLDRLDARARVALRERVRAQEHRRAHDLVRVRLADAAGVAAQEPELELLGQLLRDRARDEAAEARVDAVGVLLAAVRGLLDELAGGAHALPRRVGERDRAGVDGDLPDVLERQIVARQRPALDHAASLSRTCWAALWPAQSSSSRSSSTREASKPSIRSAAPAAAAAAPAGIRPTSSEPTTSAPRAAASSLDPRHDRVQLGRLPVLDVHAHLDEPGARKLEPERAHAREAAARLAHERGDLARGLERPAQVDVEGDQRPPHADEHAACRFRRAAPARSSGASSPASMRPLQLLRPAAAEEGRPAPGAELAVEEHRQPELLPDPRRELVRRLARELARPRPPAARAARRRPRRSAGARPRGGAGRSARARARSPREQRLDELLAGADEREDRAVVVVVGVDVEQARAARAQSRASASIVAPVTPLGEVRDGLERPRHARSLGSVKAYYDKRARRVRRVVPRGGPVRGARAAGLGGGSRGAGRRSRCTSACADARRRLRHRLPDAAPAGRGRRPRSERVDARGGPHAGAGRDATSRATRSRFRSRTARSDASSRRTSTATSRARTASASWPRRAGSRPSSSSSTPRCARTSSPEERQERILNDGSRWEVYKRYFEPQALADELGGGETVFAGRWFVAVRS